MKCLHEFNQIFLHKAVVDGRKMINGLAAIVETEMGRSPCDGALFVFTSRRRDVIRLLYWDRSGFALWIKRLEKEKFSWPKTMAGDTVTLSTQQLAWLLEGFDITRMKAHQALQYSAIS